VLFDVGVDAGLRRLSKRKLDEQQAGARIAVEATRSNPADFVLVEGIRRRRARLGRQFPTDGECRSTAGPAGTSNAR
jgi:cysteinyl-tRNA synthetase